MNVSDTHKLLFFSTGRAASRTIGDLIWNELNFYNLKENTTENATHQILYNHEKYKDYKVIISVRNPYSIVLSTWRIAVEAWETDENVYTFPIYVKSGDSVGAFQFIDRTIYEVMQIRQIDYLIHYENLLGDVLKLPFVDKQKAIRHIQSNTYYASKLLRKENNQSDFTKYYTPELADIVYKRCEWYFTSFGYARDSYLEHPSSSVSSE